MAPSTTGKNLGVLSYQDLSLESSFSNFPGLPFITSEVWNFSSQSDAGTLFYAFMSSRLDDSSLPLSL